MLLTDERIISEFGSLHIKRTGLLYLSTNFDATIPITPKCQSSLYKTIANSFLSEYRLNESLISTYGALDSQNADETDHGGHEGPGRRQEICGTSVLNHIFLHNAM